MQVYVEVMDENDNAPEFAKPYEPKVCENAPQGKVSLAQAGGRGSACLGQTKGAAPPAHSQLALHELNVTCRTALRKDDIPPTDGETEAQRNNV